MQIFYPEFPVTFCELNDLSTGTVIRDEVGLSLDNVGKEVLGHASKVVLNKETATIVGDGSTQEAVVRRVAQIKKQVEVKSICHIYVILLMFLKRFELDSNNIGSQDADTNYEKEKLNERIAKLSSGVAVIQVILYELRHVINYYSSSKNVYIRPLIPCLYFFMHRLEHELRLS